MVRRHNRDREVIVVERAGDSSAKWLFWGAMLGAGLALLYAPRSGEETRRTLQRRMWKLRAMTEEKLDELVQQFGGREGALPPLDEDEEDELAEPGSNGLAAGPEPSTRDELERRLAQARARRRADADLEEPLA